MIQQDFGHLICQPKVPTKFENLPILRDFRLKSHIFESCHLDQMQNGLDAEFDAFKPFFCVLIFPAKDGFFSKMPTFSGMCQRKVPTEKNKGLRKAPCILVASVIFQSFLSITTLLK